MRRRTAAIATAVALSGALVGWAFWSHAPDVPTTEVTVGDFLDELPLRGEVKASRSIVLLAPADAGQLRIVKLARDGAPVKKGDVVVEFDGSTVERTVQEKQSEVKQLDADIARIQSQSRTKESEAVTTSTNSQFDVRKAELEYSGRELLPRVDAEQKRLKILDAEQKHAEAEAALASARVGAQADLAAAEQKREKARRELERAERQKATLRLLAPGDGVFSIMRNWQAGGFENARPFQEGDRAWSGAQIAELPEVSTLFASARADEIERGRLDVGQTVSVRVEAVPDRELRGKIESISVLAKADFTSWPPPRTFDLRVGLDGLDARLRPGMTASLRVVVGVLKQVRLVPARAVFASNGEDVAWVVGRHGVERHVIHIARRNAEVVAVSDGLSAGDRVSLVDLSESKAGR
jgi:RND family efflux transporter MFP subunit